MAATATQQPRIRFSLNSFEYLTPPGALISIAARDPLAVPLRDTGVQRRSDFTDYNRLPFNNWTAYGLGFPRMNRETGLGVHGLYDADCETGFDSGIYLPYLDQDATDTADIPVSRFAAELGANLWLFGEDASDDIFASAWAGATTTWGAGTGFADANVKVPQAVTLVRTVLGLLYWYSTGIYFRTWNGSAWGAEVSVGATTGATSASGSDANMAKGAMVANDYYVARHTGGTIVVAKSTDGGAIFNDFAAGATVTDNYVMGMTVWKDLDGQPAPVFHGFGNVWAIDTSASVLHLLYRKAETCVNDFEGEGMTTAQDRLYVPTKDGGMDEVTLVDSAISVKHILGPGGPSTRQGYIRWMQTAGKWIFVAYDYGRNSGTQPGIYKWDTIKRTWHSVLLRDTASRQIQWLYVSTNNDGTCRLHFAERNGVTADHNSTTDERFIAVPLTDPATGATINYEPTGYIEIAEDNMGDPHVNGVVYQSRVHADGLGATASTSTEYITHKYGLNGAAYTTTTLGNYLSGTLTIIWGSHLGVEAKTIKHRLEFYRNTAGSPDTTKTPKLRDFEYCAYKNVQGGLIEYGVSIDVKASAAIQGKSAIETTLSRLDTVIASGLLVPFSFGDVGPFYVRVPPSQLGAISTEPDSTRPYGLRNGVMELRLRRILE